MFGRAPRGATDPHGPLRGRTPEDGAGDRPRLAVAMMAAAMFAYPVADAATKYLGADHPAVAVTWARLTVCALAMLPLALAAVRAKPSLGRRLLAEQTVRAVLVFAATLLFVVSITLVPLANALGACLVGPIVAAALAVRVLGEPWTRRRAVAAALGFAGALVVVRPGVSANLGGLCALAADVCYGGFLVANRACRRPVHPFAAVAFPMAFGALLLTPFAWREAGALLAEGGWLLLLIGLPSAAANVLAVAAAGMAPAGLLAPLVYLEIVGATVLGYLVFGDVPGVSTVVGIGLVVFAGWLAVRRPGRDP